MTNVDALIYDKVTQKNMNKYGIHWFKFDEPSGDVTDSKGSVIGTVAGATRVTGWNGEGNALSFNGSNQYVQFNNKVIPAGEKSIRFKIKTNSVISATQRIIALEDINNAFGARLVANGKLSFFLVQSGNIVMDCTSTTPINDGHWHDILFTWDGTTNINKNRLYIDDMKNPNSTATSITTEANVTSNSLIIGRYNPTGSNYFNGQLDDLQFYSKALTPSDFNLYQSFILDNNEYKIYNSTTSSWETVTTTTPTIEQFVNDGMDSLTPLLDRVNGYSPVDELSSTFKIKTWTNDVNTKLILESPTPAQIVYPIGDISLFGVETVDSIVLTSGGNSKVGISFDSGETWLAYKNSEWIKLDSVHNGMTISEINNLTNEQIMEAKGESQTIRFAYSLIDNSAWIDKIELRVSMYGEEKIASSSDYEMDYDTSTKSIIFNVSKSGTYSVNYVDSQ